MAIAADGDDDLLLLECNEDIGSCASGSSSPCSSSGRAWPPAAPHLLCRAIDMDRHGEEQALRNLASREVAHSPGPQYRSSLESQPLVSAARSNAVDWMIKVRGVYGFSPATVALSVSYLDRYLAKELRHKVWKAWMIELLSIACLSLAAKMEETFVPLLQDLQIEGLEHLFESVTIQRMEVSVMKLLEWRLNSITAFSFVGGLLRSIELQQHLKLLAWNRINELLLGTLAEIVFLDFSASVVAVAATVCALQETVPLQAQALKQLLLGMLLVEEASFDKCCGVVEDVLVDPICPVSSSSQVLLLDTLRACSSEGESNASRKRSKPDDGGGGGGGGGDGDAASKKKRSSQ
ncbi:cyclin-D2-1 [Selaginella moellendorffii]|uniref:cyclin-D2-1 n=1 Tax=Selaginella moellendorffii TaxID=88036 RepID=UPI000D1C2848|nr:cyclin-D2-1 [Selaginella moellendorffii]|eukprot:XP_024541903.1 cyclin-D2-1 [Selaginella moellendorffii]